MSEHRGQTGEALAHQTAQAPGLVQQLPPHAGWWHYETSWRWFDGHVWTHHAVAGPPNPQPMHDPSMQAPVQQQAPMPQVDIATELQRFAALRDQGLITPEDFEAKKRQLLGL